MKIQETIKKAIQNDIDREKVGIAFHDALVKIFEPFEGKQISKRMATVVQKAYPDNCVCYEKQFGMFHLRIWGNGIEYNDRQSFLLGYDSNPYYCLGCWTDTDSLNPAKEKDHGFAYHNCCNGGAAKIRNEKRLEMLNNGTIDKLAKITKRYIAAKKEFDEVDAYYTPSWYSIKKALNI